MLTSLTRLSALFIILFSNYGRGVDFEPCQEGWFHVAQLHSCFLTPLHPADWQEAEDFCTANDAHLASVRNPDEASIIKPLLARENPSFFNWLGLRRNSLLGNFTWSDGSDYSFDVFALNEPSDNGHCVAWSMNDQVDGWLSINCDYSQFFLCRAPAQGARAQWYYTNTGNITSPNYPQEYRNHVRRTYFIKAENGTRILITFNDVDTEADKDVITVLDGLTEESRTIGKLSGFLNESVSFLTSNNTATIRFRTDEDTVGSGFAAVYTVIKRQPLKTYESTFDTITNPGFPDSSPSYTFADYLIRCPKDFHVEITVSNVLLEQNNVLIFHQGPTNQDYKITTLRGSASGQKMGKETFKSTRNAVFFSFDSGEQTRDNSWTVDYQCKFDANLGEEIEI